MRKAELIIGCLLLSLLVLPLQAMAVKSYYSDGNVDNNSGTPNKDLVFRDFEITPDGFITGYIMNQSNHTIKSFNLNIWLTNKAETQILWRKSLSIGDLAPKGKYDVKEPYPATDDQVVFKFKLPGSNNFRNPQ